MLFINDLLYLIVILSDSQKGEFSWTPGAVFSKQLRNTLQ
jgi:hypothetical protein